MNVNETYDLLSVPFIQRVRKDYSKVLKKQTRDKKLQDQLLNKLECYLNNKPFKLYKGEKIKLSERDLFIERLCISINEITSSMVKIYMTMVYVRNLRHNKYYNKEEQLQYFYENYINEQYIYTERILNIISFLEKKVEKLHLDPYYKMLVNARQDYKEICKSVREVRNEHNHRLRFTNYHFDRLKIIGSEHIRGLVPDKEREKIYKSIKKKYVKEMFDEIVNMHKITRTIFIPIEIIVYDVILPKL